GSELVLLVPSGSVTLPDTVALLVTEGAAAGPTATVRVMADVAPLARPAAFVQVTAWPTALQLHPVPVPDTKVSPAGSVSVTVRAPESEGPLLPIVRV